MCGLTGTRKPAHDHEPGNVLRQLLPLSHEMSVTLLMLSLPHFKSPDNRKSVRRFCTFLSIARPVALAIVIARLLRIFEPRGGFLQRSLVVAEPTAPPILSRQNAALE